MQRLLLIASVLVGLAACDVEVRVPTKIEIAAAPISGNLVGNIERGRRIAERCANCHGMEGASVTSGAPFISGLTQEYLVRSLLAYRDGTRNHKSMLEASIALNPLALADVTAYYASLKTAWQGVAAGAKSRAVLDDHQARSEAEHIVTACRSCHNHSGRQQKEAVVPSLDGMPLEYFIPALKSYANGLRNDETMAMFKDKLNEHDIYKLGAYFAARQPVKPKALKLGNPARGKIAARACAGCHGFDGNSLNPHIPNLTGQPAKYLIKTINDYRSGLRKDALMQEAVANLNDHTIKDLAAFFSRQQPRSQLHRDVESINAFDPLLEGEQIAAACNSCHGDEGNSRTAGIPSLTGLSVKYIVRATQAYQHGFRKHPAMQEIVSFFSDTDIEKAAYYYATRIPHDPSKPSSATVTRGEVLAEACVQCHGPQGVSTDPVGTPSLAGQDMTYLIRATQAYVSGERMHDVMKGVALQLQPQQVRDLAAYFSAQSAQQVETFLPDDPAYLIAQRCSRCHGDRGYSTQAGVPRLAGQLESYFVYAMKEYQEGVRKDPQMMPMAAVLSLLEIKALAAYYARQ